MVFYKFLKKFIVGFSYGVSFPLTIVILDYWLKDCGVKNATIGLFSIFHLPFALKLLFAPFIDRYNIPFFSRFLGRRRSWVLASQIFLIVGILCMANTDPRQNIFLLMFFASCVALADGFQNIALYSYQISDISEEEFGYAASMISFGHRIGSIAVKVATLYVAQYFGWKVAYEVAAVFVFACMIFYLFTDEPQDNRIVGNDSDSSLDTKSVHGLSSPIQELSKEVLRIAHTKNGAYTILILLLYKATDYTIQKMSRVFCVEVGFSKVDIANIVQFCGSVSVILGGFLAGFVINKKGTFRAMIFLAIFHMFSLFSYVFLAQIGNNLNMLSITIFMEGLSGGAVSAAFIAFLYEECKTGSQYALLWAIHELGAMLFRFMSGFLVDSLGWVRFFILAPLFSIPCILVLRKLLSERKRENSFVM